MLHQRLVLAKNRKGLYEMNLKFELYQRVINEAVSQLTG
jgi:hypothetical protein